MRVITKNGEISPSQGSGRRRGGPVSIRFDGTDEVILLVCVYANEKGDELTIQVKLK